MRTHSLLEKHPYLLRIMKIGICSNPRYSWVTYFILSNICYFSQLILSILSTHPLFPLSIFVTLSVFRRLNKRLSFSCPLLSIHFLRYYLTLKKKHLLYTPHTQQLSFLSYRAHALCGNTTFLLTRRLWPSYHSDMGG